MSTKIEWTNETWNPVSGCTKVSQGCKHCYAERIWPKVSGAEAKRLGTSQPRPFTQVECHPERLDDPIRVRTPKRWFVNSMSDLFHEDVPEHFIASVFAFMAYARHHTFQVLTKRPQRMLDLLTTLRFHDEYDGACSLAHDVACEVIGRRGEFDPNNRRRDDIRAFDAALPLANVWLGVSVEDQETANERIPLLLQTPAPIRFLSCEPLLGPLTIFDLDGPIDLPGDTLSPLHWVIAGGESGPNARPSHPDWFRSLRDQCAAAGVAFFFKQWGEWAPGECGSEKPMTRTERVATYWADKWEYSAMTPTESMHTHSDDGPDVHRLGKKVAGRTLDGVTHDAYPPCS